jgi:hypothetical protein
MFFKFLVRPTGLEPVTHSLEGCCSIQMSYGRNNDYFYDLTKYKFTRRREKKQVFLVIYHAFRLKDKKNLAQKP